MRDYVPTSHVGFLNAGSGSAFDPRDSGKVSAWLRLANGTVTGSGYSSIPDVLNSNPAVQVTDAQRPTNGTAANGLPIMTFAATQLLTVPLITGNNGNIKWGMGFYAKAANVIGNKFLFNVTSNAGTASANKIQFDQTAAQIRIIDQGSARRAQSGTLDTNWHFIYCGVDCSKGTEATQVIQAIDSTFQAVSFSADTAWPATLTAGVTGSGIIGSGTVAGSASFVGSFGPNLFFFNDLLTQAELTAIAGFEVPT